MIDEELEEQMRPLLPKDVPAIFISSVSGYHVTELKDMLWKALHE
jgi:GTP-binding protein